MTSFKVEYNPMAKPVDFVLLTGILKQKVDKMEREGRIKDAVEELRVERAAMLRKVEELDHLINGLESRISNGSGTVTQTIILHDKEFEQTGIAKAAETMIRRARKPLHVKDIAKGLVAGGYKFQSKNHPNSVAPVLYQTAARKNSPLVRLPKNTYSLEELETKK